MEQMTLHTKFAATGARDIMVSRLALGTAQFGVPGRETDHQALLDTFLEKGGTFVDTALVYGTWLDEKRESYSEKFLGRWRMQAEKNAAAVISTKGAHPLIGTQEPRVKPACIAADVSESCSNLKMHKLDVYFLHRDDEDIPVSVIMDALNREAEQGRLNLLGASNWTAARIYQANDYCVQHGLRGFDLSQICFNILHTTPAQLGDRTLVSMTEEAYRLYQDMQMPVMAFTAQAGGYVMKYFDTPDALVPSRYACSTVHKRMQRIRTLCRESGLSPTAVTLAYLMSQSLPVIPVIGVSGMEQLQDCIAQADQRLTAEQLACLDV